MCLSVMSFKRKFKSDWKSRGGRRMETKGKVLKSTTLSDIPEVHPSMRSDEDAASFPPKLEGSV